MSTRIWSQAKTSDTTFSYICEPVDPIFSTCGDDVNYQGYNYATLQIGDQCWFAENLRYLPNVSSHFQTGSGEWSTGGDPGDFTPYAYVYGYNGADVEEAQSQSNYSSFGAL